MGRKAILLASVAGAMMASAPAHAEGFYFSAFGGANFIRSQDGSFGFVRTTGHEHFDPDTGFLLGAALGVGLDHWLHGLKVELETSYRRNDVGGHWDAGACLNGAAIDAQIICTGGIGANMSTFALMANAWYEFDIGTRFKPYFGGGIGWARSQIDGAFEFGGLGLSALSVNPFNGFSAQSSGFAYQVGFGVTSEIMPGVSLGLGYRFFDGPNTDFFFGGKILSVSNGNIKFEDQNHSVALSLNIDIN